MARRKTRDSLHNNQMKNKLVSEAPELVSVDDVRPAVYNPRQALPARLDLVELSLSRFGWLLPIYITKDGEILSGHQRHHVATERLGQTEIPAVTVDLPDMQGRRSLNIMFNQMTNDLPDQKTASTLVDTLEHTDIPERVRALPVAEDLYPILTTETRDIAEMFDLNPLWKGDGSTLRSKEVMKTIGLMPAVVSESGRIINGHPRLAAAITRGVTKAPTVTVSDDVADLAHGMLNLLSMKYDMQGAMKDHFRSNAIMAAPLVREAMSYNSTYDLLQGKSPMGYFDQDHPEHAAAWVDMFGPTVIDIGAGNYWDARHFEQMGANVVAYEPFHGMDPNLARAAAREWFFDRLTPDHKFSFVFLSNVINSVPFDEDRDRLIDLTSLFCDDDTIMAASTRGTGETRVATSESLDKMYADHEGNNRVSFPLGKALSQKFHAPEEFADLFSRRYTEVELASGPISATAPVVRCRRPRPMSRAEAIAAVEFEFDVPFTNGERLGLAGEAIELLDRCGRMPKE